MMASRGIFWTFTIQYSIHSVTVVSIWNEASLGYDGPVSIKCILFLKTY